MFSNEFALEYDSNCFCLDRFGVVNRSNLASQISHILVASKRCLQLATEDARMELLRTVPAIGRAQNFNMLCNASSCWDYSPAGCEFYASLDQEVIISETALSVACLRDLMYGPSIANASARKSNKATQHVLIKLMPAAAQVIAKAWCCPEHTERAVMAIDGSRDPAVVADAWNRIVPAEPVTASQLEERLESRLSVLDKHFNTASSTIPRTVAFAACQAQQLVSWVKNDLCDTRLSWEAMNYQKAASLKFLPPNSKDQSTELLRADLASFRENAFGWQEQW